MLVITNIKHKLKLRLPLTTTPMTWQPNYRPDNAWEASDFALINLCCSASMNKKDRYAVFFIHAKAKEALSLLSISRTPAFTGNLLASEQ